MSVTIRDYQNRKWDAVYLSEADKLYFTNVITKDSWPKTIKEDVVIYFNSNNEVNGLIINNLMRNHILRQDFRGIIDFLSKKTVRGSIRLPYSEELIGPLVRMINPSNL